MIRRKLIWFSVWSVVLGSILACKPTGRIGVLSNPFLSAASKPKIMARDLDNPMSPRLFGDKLVFSQSGRGEVSAMPLEGGQVTSLITGFGLDTFGGYNISAQGITIDPRTGRWIVCAAERPGKVLMFDPATFPTDVVYDREIPVLGATDDNPFAAVLIDHSRILIVSSGTSKAYRAFIDDGHPPLLEPILEVETGIIGLAVDPVSGNVFGAIFGSSHGDGSIVRWDPASDTKSVRTVASGFSNLIDVAFTPEGKLLALEFGEFGVAGKGAISIIATDGSGKITPFIKGLNNPSGIFVGSDQKLFITEFGVPANGQNGAIISIDLAAVPGDSPTLSIRILIILVLLILSVLLVIGVFLSRRRAARL